MNVQSVHFLRNMKMEMIDYVIRCDHKMGIQSIGRMLFMMQRFSFYDLTSFRLDSSLSFMIFEDEYFFFKWQIHFDLRLLLKWTVYLIWTERKHHWPHCEHWYYETDLHFEEVLFVRQIHSQLKHSFGENITTFIERNVKWSHKWNIVHLLSLKGRMNRMRLLNDAPLIQSVKS